MYYLVEFNEYHTIIHSVEFNPNEMELLKIGNYEFCQKEKNKMKYNNTLKQ